MLRPEGQNTTDSTSTITWLDVVASQSFLPSRETHLESVPRIYRFVLLFWRHLQSGVKITVNKDHAIQRMHKTTDSVLLPWTP